MFQNRTEAGRQLAARLVASRRDQKAPEPAPLVLGLPRGGVIVAAIVAEILDAELDVCLVRKMGVPWQPELAFGAVAEGGVRVVDDSLVQQCSLTRDEIDDIAAKAETEIQRRRALYRGSHPQVRTQGREVIVVDDGLATGATMFAAVRSLRSSGASRVVVAVPVAPPSTVELLAREASEVVCLETPAAFISVGSWYDDFTQVEDEQVQEALALSRARAPVLRRC